jgi:GDP-L-fucose synthase
MDKSSRIVVTGGNGFLGSSVMKKLAEAGYSNVETFSSKEFDLRYQNIASNMFSTFNPDVVIHLAASVGGIGANMANPGKFCYDNLVMGTNIIESCRLFDVKKLVIAGTICAYPCHTPVPFKESNLWNGYPEPTNAPYGLAKKMLMVLADGYRKQYGLNSITLFPVNLYGKGDHFDLENSHVIPAMIRKFHEAKIDNHRDVTLWGDGSPTREFLYVEDCAEAFVDAMERYDSPDPVNIGSGKEISMLELANKIQAIVGHEGRIIWDSSRPNGQPRRCLDVSLAKAVLDWQAKTDFNEGLRNTYNWFLNSSEKK